MKACLAFVALACLLNVCKCRCPAGAIQGLDTSTCYTIPHYGAGNAPFFDAEEICRKEGGHLTSIHSAFENAFVKDMINVYPPNNRLWIGGTTLVKGTWAWTDGTPFSFNNWAAGQPTSSADCIQFETDTGVWEVRECYGSANALMPICKVPAIDGVQPTCPTQQKPTTSQPRCASPCEPGWTYYGPTASCFMETQAGKFYDVLSWCQAMNSSLASIHGMDQNSFLAAMFAFKNYMHSSSNAATYVGLYDPLRSHAWEWTDGSSVNFTNWKVNQPDGDGYCVNIYGDPANLGLWNDLPCTDAIPAICEKPATF